MPRMSGVELVRKLKSVSPTIKVVLCTGNGEDAGNESFDADWIDALVLKPADAANVASKLRELIDSRAMASE
jgi:CheY-like chemotaxis protein